MVSDANGIDENTGSASAGDAPAAPGSQATSTATQTRSWSMPKAPVSRKQVDEFGRAATKVVGSLARALAEVARYGARVVTAMWRAIDEVPVALRVLFVLAVVMLLGIAGSIALPGTAGLLCAIVAVPVSSVAVGALGHRWVARNGTQHPAAPARSAQPSELARSIVYVDRKLTLALNSFGSERHQQAVIALFQAKTAVELALGTEQDIATHIDEPVSVDDYGLRPRIRAGQSSTSAPPEDTSLAAS